MAIETEAGEKVPDCVKWTCSTRDRISAEIRGMLHEEMGRWFEDRRPTDPFLAELFDRRKVPVDGRPPLLLDEPSSPDPSDESDRNEEKMNGNEIIFEVSEAPEGGYNARALGHGILTQGED